MRRRVWVSWSCGKDGAFALHTLRSRDDIEVAGLLTTIDAAADEVTMSRVPAELLRAQAAALGLPVRTVELPWPCPNEVYERRTTATMARLRREGAEDIAFGDLFLADIRAYRERSLLGTGLAARFPLWDRPTTELAQHMQAAGLKAVIVCVDPTQAPAWIAGRSWDDDLLRDLPADVDPCGENGEFHTFVTDGPGFAHPVDVAVGRVTEHDGFLYAPVDAVR